MTEFLSATLGFPAVLFSSALVVVVCFWLLVLAGAADHHAFDADLEAEAIGFGGVPVAVSASLFLVVAWFTSLTGSVLLRRSALSSGTKACLAAAVLAAALVVGWAVVRLLVRHLRRYAAEPPPSRRDFVGQVCAVRTGSVTTDFGQAEVAAPDGSTAIVQVRLAGPDTGYPLAFGSSGLLYAYDAEGEFFWVAPYDAALDPGPRVRKPGLPRDAG
ncbi:hypothetical protein HY68_30885 [Streptomyces sp. AcH 505]|uniref:hypothetical protein n=1 Tax=unclassified Streptomyces TaxID=2593676 RepID=UPI000591F49D|nr:hypothetical protein [Streptomyces sp. NBC_00370]KIF66434.1 hypothetical protein HY68_30885 [Streptomyces sp. AcH 505]